MRKQLILLVFLMLLPSKALSQGCVECEADIDGDGSVALSDLTIMRAEYGTLTCCDKYPAPVVKTGQTTCSNIDGDVISCAGTDQDGDLQTGVDWPDPRFTDNGDGTVTDNLTGLTWLKDANCAYTIGYDPDGGGDGTMSWQHAFDFIAGINDGTYSACGAGYNDWRLPNAKEIQSLIHFEFSYPPIPNTEGTGKWTEGNPFTGGIDSIWIYWTSTTYADTKVFVWVMDITEGSLIFNPKNDGGGCIWPVRGGQ